MAETLVLMEHNGERVQAASLRAVTFAQRLSGDYSLLVLGHSLDELAGSVTHVGAKTVLIADDDALTEPLADRYAAVIEAVMRETGARYLMAAASTFSKDILPRVAALLDAPMLSDVLGVEQSSAGLTFQRPMYAGSVIGSVQVEGEPLLVTVRPTAFDDPAPSPDASPVEAISLPANLPSGMEFVSREQMETDRPDLTEARVVVTGGRPLQSPETFQELIGGLADQLGAAVGATRAAVDAGLAPNDYQVGQTGKVVAPELYIAIGVSGSIQHLAGMKDSKVITAINKDPEAPIFQVATYGLVADLFEAVPQLVRALQNHSDPA